MAKPMVQLNIRMEPETHARLSALADRNRRSMNAEVLYRIEAAIAAEQGRQTGGATAAGQASQA